MALRNEENARRGLTQHAAILTALRSRDVERAVALAEEHDHSTIRHLRSRMKSVENPGDAKPAAIATTDVP
jgi:DNA-binding GntR family transcriptional regulator